MKIIPEKIRSFWSDEEIRILVLASLLLQILLISLSLLRQQRRNRLLSFLLWSAYLGADFVATLALGNLLNKENDAAEQSDTGDITAFWSPFLLLHLGGPDTITSYSLEDNLLWQRHLLGLVLQVLTAIFAFMESLPSPDLWAVAIVVFASGIIKYAERTWSLRSASVDPLRSSSMDQLRQSMIDPPFPGPKYDKFLLNLQSRQSAGLDARIKIEKQPYHSLTDLDLKKIDDKEIILQGHRFFQTSKRLLVDLKLSLQDFTESQTFFLKLNPRQAFQVVEVELSFLHDILHTKASYVHSFFGRIMRVFSFAMAFLALFLFRRSKHPFKPVDVIITYILLIAAIVLETAAVLLLIFSDWTIVVLHKHYMPSQQKFLSRIQSAVHICLPKCASLLLTIRKFFLRSRWSNSMKQYNLIRIFLTDCNMTPNKKRLKHLLQLLQLKELWDTWWYVRHVDFSEDAKRLIFQELKNKAASAEGIATNYKRLKACRGEWVLREKGYSTLLDWSMKKEFDESILLWHIATYLCYQEEEEEEEEEKEKEKQHKDGQCEKIVKFFKERIKKIWDLFDRIINTFFGRIKKILERVENILKRNGFVGTDEQKSDAEKKSSEEEQVDIKKISKQISDYLMYLVVFQPAMLPAGIGKIRLQDTCAEATKFFTDKNTEIMEELEKLNIHKQQTTTINRIKSKYFSWINSQDPLSPIKEIERWLNKNKELLVEKEKLARDFLLRVDSSFYQKDQVKGDRSKSVLWDACKLAKDLKTIKDDTGKTNPWNIIGAVWVEMLCYAAGNCNAYAHAKQLSQGGELLTHIWLLMAHMGIGEQYRFEPDYARAKLFVKV